MKALLRDPYNLALLFLTATALWGIVSFFSYHIAPLPAQLPIPLFERLSAEVRPGERIYLADQRFDRFVGAHPQLNIFPGSGRNAQMAAGDTQFFLVGGTSLRSDFAALDGFDRRELGSVDGVTLWRFDRRDASYAEYRLSDSFPDGVRVRSSRFPEGALFRNGEFLTGHAAWERAQIKEGHFGEVKRTALSVHPLDGGDEWVELTVDPVRWRAATMLFEYGIADSGDCKGQCPPVRISVRQGDRGLDLESGDGRWDSRELSGFNAADPVTVRLSVEKGGKRHFYCDLVFRAPLAGGAR